jgi:translation initiation factor IF-2
MYKEKIMLNFLKKLFGAPEAKPAEPTEANVSAPYKVPEPAATTPIPLVVATEPAPEEKPAKAVKAPAKPKEPKAPAAAKKAPAKPRAPKAPKTTQ